MKVSVIMGVYNDEKTVGRAIDSIIRQTFKDWIFIICDDGSTDGTSLVLEKYKNVFPDKFVILQNKKNRGLTYTLNHCLEYVNSEYVARMDADDISLPERLQIELEFLESHQDYSFVSCGVERFDETGVWSSSLDFDEDPSVNEFYYSSVFTHPTVMIRKSALDEVKGYHEVWYTTRCEDYDLWMRLYAKGFRGYRIKKILFQYYEGKNSFPKRKYKFRIGEAVTRAKGYKALKMYPKGAIYVLKPLIAGLIPRTVVKKLHRSN